MPVQNRTNIASTSGSHVVPIRGYARQLESLYARRSTVEALIQSLENYERFRAKPFEQGNRKTA